MKVVKIEKLKNEDVYNMEVHNHHNFAVNGGFIVHNCDAIRYFCSMRTRPSETPVKSDPNNPTPEEQYQNGVRDVMGGEFSVRMC